MSVCGGLSYMMTNHYTWYAAQNANSGDIFADSMSWSEGKISLCRVKWIFEAVWSKRFGSIFCHHWTAFLPCRDIPPRQWLKCKAAHLVFLWDLWLVLLWALQWARFSSSWLGSQRKRVVWQDIDYLEATYESKFRIASTCCQEQKLPAKYASRENKPKWYTSNLYLKTRQGDNRW